MRTKCPAVLLAGSLAAAPALAQPVVFDNGPFITNPGAGFNGADISIFEAGTVLSLGFNENAAPPNGPVRVGDDFTISGAPPGGLALSKMHFAAVQSQSGAFTTDVNFAAAYLTLYSGDPSTGAATVIAGDFTTNRLIDTVWTGAYRVTSSSQLSQARPIMRLIVDLAWVPPLADGTYWFVISTVGDAALSATPNPQAILVTPRLPGSNGVQYFNSTWFAAADYPFTLFGAGCAADFNGADGATVQDIYDFLADWSSQAAGGPVILASADFNSSGSVTVQDIYDFLAAWSGGCPG